MARPDYGRARWYGAHGSNYTSANRGRPQISRVIVHVTQGSFSSAINWFWDSRANASAHYTVRSNDGFIGQSVEEKDIAWHAGNWTYNQTSIGIEHEGYVSNPAWFTAAMYQSSARLTAHLCNKYGIPTNRDRIIGHNEVPGATHTDPGRYWDWPRYMRLVRGYASPVYRQVVDNANSARFYAPSNWGVSTWSSQKYGGNYRHTLPGSRTRWASFKIRTPSRGRYAVHAWWPANSGYNDRTLFRIYTTGGWVGRRVNQRTNGGRWVHLGTYGLGAGDDWRIQTSNRSSSNGYIIADAIRITRA
jgi:hypothetical protein